MEELYINTMTNYYMDYLRKNNLKMNFNEAKNGYFISVKNFYEFMNFFNFRFFFSNTNSLNKKNEADIFGKEHLVLQIKKDGLLAKVECQNKMYEFDLNGQYIRGFIQENCEPNLVVTSFENSGVILGKGVMVPFENVDMASKINQIALVHDANKRGMPLGKKAYAKKLSKKIHR